MKIDIPELCLVVLIGPSGAGKSTLAKRLFKRTEVISSDICRGLVSDDENDQSASADAFELLRLTASKRLARGRFTVVDDKPGAGLGNLFRFALESATVGPHVPISLLSRGAHRSK